MGSIQFQDEPAICDSVDLPARDRMQVVESHQTGEGAVTSLLFGLRYRGWVTDTEKEFLDGLADAHGIVFVIRDNHYLHPEDVELFPLELIEGAMTQGDGAVFSHRYLPPDDRHGRTYEIQTGVINPGRPEPLILGHFGPNSDTDRRVAGERFCKLVCRFRDTYDAIDSLDDRIRDCLSSRIPALIVNRSSGRIMCLNRAATRLLGEDEAELVDHEFQEMKACLYRLMHNRKLAIHNLSGAGLNLSLVSFEVTATTEATKEPFLANFFLYRFRHRISNIMIAASLLKATAEESLTEDETILAQTIIDETRELDQSLTRLSLLWDYDSMAVSSTNLVTEIEHAIDLVSSSLERECLVRICDRADSANLEAGGTACVSLFESILMAHLLDRPESPTSVSINRDGDSRLSIRMDTENQPTGTEARIDPQWAEYACRLAERMNISLTTDRLLKGRVLRTELTVNLPRQVATP
jgi:hypothetical protein